MALNLTLRGEVSSPLTAAQHDANLTAIEAAVNAFPTLGTGVAAALAVNVGGVGAPVVQNGALGTPSSGTLTNAAGLPTGGISLAASTRLLGRATAGAGVAEEITLGTSLALSGTTLNAAVGGFKQLKDYFTSAQWTAISTDSWGGVSISDISTALENAFAEAEGKWTLTFDGPAYFKVNRPIRFYGRLNILCPMGMYSFITIYPDLSVDWRTTYSRRGVIESANYQYPTLPPGKGSWPNSKPDFVAGTRIQGISVDADRDSLYSANKNRVPDYGIVIHCANEAFSMSEVYGNRCGIAGILLSGLQSTPTLYNCGGFNNGRESDTVLGAAVTRTTGGAFGAAVYVWVGTNIVEGAGIYLEAATNTDLNAIIAGNVLTINGVGYTVSTLGSTTLVNERTIIAGVATTQRYIRRVTFTGNVATMTQGRKVPSGLAISYQPQGASFAVGISAADGGQGDAGMVNLINFSGDYNHSLITCESRSTVNAWGTKSENNGSMFRSHNTEENGGNGRIVTFTGYRAEGSFADHGLFRVIGHLGRLAINSSGNVVGTGTAANLVEAYYDGSASNIVNHGNGRGPFFWNAQSDRVMYFNGVEIWDKNVKAARYEVTSTVTITGSRGGNAALANLLTELAARGLIVDGSTA